MAGGAGEGGGQRGGADRGRCGGHRANVLLLSVQALGPALHVFGDLSAETPNESTTYASAPWGKSPWETDDHDHVHASEKVFPYRGREKAD